MPTDTERMDWLEANDVTIDREVIGPGNVTEDAIVYLSKDDREAVAAPTLREAIDKQIELEIEYP